MNSKNSIVLISDDKNLSEKIASKLVFLRNNDEVLISGYKEAVNSVKLAQASIVLVHETNSKSKTVELIDELRKEDVNLCIILLADSVCADLILNAYDAGADDYALSNAENYELVIRTVHNIKHSSAKFKALRNQKLLEQLNVIDDMTGLYNYKYAKQVIENEIDDNLLDDGAFMALTPDEESKTVFSIEKMASAVLTSIRAHDIAVLGKGAKVYVLMPKTDINGSITVLNKIKEAYGADFRICAGISSIAHKNFNEMEHDALHALSEAVSTNVDYVVASDKEDTLDEWLDDSVEMPKNYKIFRQIFNKKMEKVIAPVFFRLQKTYEEKLFDTKIEQYTDAEQCVFHLKNQNQDSTLRIVYPGFAKIIVYITHEGLDSPENREIQLALTKISQKELVKIVEDFIKEFKYTAV